MRRTPASGLVWIRPAVSVGVMGEHVVAKEGKTARELVALVKNELHIKEVELEVYRHRHVGWYATRCLDDIARRAFSPTWSGAAAEALRSNLKKRAGKRHESLPSPPMPSTAFQLARL